MSKDSSWQNRPYKAYSLLPATVDVAAIIKETAADCECEERDVEDVYPCTPLQAGLMISTLKSAAAYICHFNYKICQDTDIERLRFSWDQLIATEHVLRNRIIWNHSTQSLFQATIAHYSSGRTGPGLKSTMALGDNLCRARLVEDTETQRWTLELSIHHSIFDGWSIRLILQKLKAIYAGSPPSPGLPFTSFIHHLASKHAIGCSESQEFWEQYLSGASVLNFPPLPSNIDHEIVTDGTRSIRSSLDIESLTSKYCVSPATVLYAASAIVLGGLSDRNDVTFGLTLSGRDVFLSSIEEMVGPAIATVPFRTHPDPNTTVETFLQEIQAQVLEIIPFQHHGLQNIRRISADTEAGCRFRTLITVQPKNQFIADSELFEKVRIADYDLIDNLPLSIEVVPEEGHLLLNCSFQTACLSEGEVDLVLSHLMRVLEALSYATSTSNLAQLPSTTGLDTDRTRSEVHKHQDSSTLPSSSDSIARRISISRIPESDSELQVEEIFQQVFQITGRLTINTNFFELGGDSFTAINVTVAARKRGYILSVGQIYQNPFLGDLAALAEAAPKISKSDTPDEMCTSASLSTTDKSQLLWKEAARLCCISENEIEDVYPASTFQEDLAATSISEIPSGDCKLYVATIVLNIPQQTDPERLRGAVNSILAQNPILRTRLIHSSHGTMQVVTKYFSSSNGEPSSSNMESTVPEESHRLFFGEGKPLFYYELCTGSTRSQPRLVLTIHHALYDAWTLERVLDDLNHQYFYPQNIRPKRQPYSQFIRYVANIDEAAAASYWTHLLKDMPLFQFPEIPNTDYRPQAKYLSALIEKVDWSHTKVQGISAATVIACAWAVLLSSYCDTENICYGTVLSGRDAISEDIMGPTISTVPMRLTVDRSQKVTDFLTGTQTTLLGMQDFQHYGLGRISRLPTQGPRNACRFTSLLVMQQDLTHLTTREGQSLFKIIDEQTQMYLSYPLVASISTTGDTMSVDLQYDDRCISSVKIQRLARRFCHIVKQLAFSDCSIRDIETVTPEDKAQILAWNQPPLPDSRSLLHHLFEEMVSRRPLAIAIDSTFDDSNLYRKLTYGQLNAYANELASQLNKHDSPNRFVGICFGKSALAVISMIAILKAGRAFVPLDPSAPTARIQTMMENLGQDALLITESAQVSRFADSELVILDDRSLTIRWKQINGETTCLSFNDNQQEQIVDTAHCSIASSRKLPEDTAYLLHTSGSTGTPKGIIVSHASCCTALKSLCTRFDINCDNRILQNASFLFDISILEVFGTLTSGGCVCLLSDAERSSGELQFAVSEMQVNFLLLTPTMAEMLEPQEFPSLRCLSLVGEAPTRQILERWVNHVDGFSVFNGYGPAEAGIICCGNVSVAANDPCNIGRPIACHLFIADLSHFEKLAAIGTVGELVICGSNLADGYLGDLVATNRVFGSDPPWFPNRYKRGTRYYRTGDLVKYNDDGSLHYVGRRDLQRKIHGQRIELGEIECQIMKYGMCEGAVVELLGTSTLVAFLKTAKSNGDYTGVSPPGSIRTDLLDELVINLKAALPTYMVPCVFVPTEHFPTTISGKTDRRLLSSSVEQSINLYQYGKSSFKRPPATENQSLMKNFWAEAIPIPAAEIGIDDGFFDLGGTSVSVIRLLMLTRKHHMKFDVSTVYRCKTLSEMAAKLEMHNHQFDADVVSPQVSLIETPNREASLLAASRQCGIPRSSVVTTYPCSDMQAAMMMSSEKNPGSYFSHNAYLISGKVDISQLVLALKVVWKRHEILRSRIYLDGEFSSTQAVFDEALDVPIIEQDHDTYLTSTPAPRYGEALSRCAILRKDHVYLVVSQHHAVFDAWSLDLLIQDIKNQYAGRPIEPVPIEPYSKFIEYTLQAQKSSFAAHYWREALLDSRVSWLPQVRKTTIKANREHKATIEFPARHIASLAIMIEAAWAILLGRYTDSEDVCFGVVRSGRTAPVTGIDTIMGPTIVSIPRRLRPTRKLRTLEFIRQVEKTTSEALPWEHYGLRNMRKLGESARHVCDFPTMVVVQHQAESLRDIEVDFDLHLIEEHSAWSDDCITLECQPNSDGTIAVSLSYDDKAISKNEVEWIIHHFSRLMSELGTRQDQCIEELDLAGSHMVAQTRFWNQNPITISPRRIEDLFCERLRSWPTLTAIDAVDARLTYQELDDLSSVLAFDLKASGLERGELVPLCLEKSALMMIAILAVLKAGGAYVPMEIDHPLERMKYIVHDVQAQRLLCMKRQEALCRQLACPVFVLDIGTLRRSLVEFSTSTKTLEIKREQYPSSDLAYVVYTSGSTGHPKGVLIEHTALSTTILQRARILGHKEGLRCILHSSYAFDSSIWEMFAPLLHGSLLFIPDNEQRLANLPEYLNDNKIEMFATTPTVAQNIIQYPSKCPHLKTLDLGGEAMTRLIVDDWSEHVRLVNDYGPTEACIDACMNPNVSLGDDPNNIGYGDGDATHLWVVEPADYSKLAPVGCLGELLISGPTLARGYLNDEEKTSKAFIDCSAFNWVMKGEERCYATGDLVRRNADGSLTFSGRKDLQVQIYGIRIEIGEIEYVLGRCKGIRLAVIDRVFQAGSDIEMLVGFLTVEGVSDERSRETLLIPDRAVLSILNDAFSKLRGRLPKYMVPNILLPMHQIPTSTGGKADRKTLRKFYAGIPSETFAAYKSHSMAKRSPHTENQKKLQVLWELVLGVDVNQIGLDDDFLILGGDSLAAIKLSSKAAEIGLRLTVPEIFLKTRFEDMAASVRQPITDCSYSKSEDPAPFSLLGGLDVLSHLDSQEEVEDIMPASAIQTSFIVKDLRWYSYQPCYIWFFLDVDSRFTPSCLQSACNTAIQRHSILRTSFHVIGRQCYQVICKNRVADFKVLSSGGQMDQISCHLIDQDVQQSVQLGQIPTRFRLIINDTTGHRRLGVGLSHAQYDGFCTDSILSELFYLSTGKLDQSRPPEYSRFIKHSLEVAQKPETDSFWAHFLDKSEVTRIVPEPTVQQQQDTKHHNILRTLPSLDKRPGGMSFAIVMKTAWSLVLSHLSHSTDIIFGSVVSGRNAPFDGASEVFGPCLNILPVRLRIDSHQSFLDLLKHVHEQQVAMIPYESTPFEQFARQAAWPAGTRFGSVVQHQNIPRTSVAQEGGVAGLEWKYAGSAAYDDVVIEFVDFWLTTLPDGERGMKCWLTSREDTMPEKLSERVMEFFLAVVKMINERPEAEVGVLDTLGYDLKIENGLGVQETSVFDPEIEDGHSLARSTPQQQEPVVENPLPSNGHTSTTLRSLWETALQPSPIDPSSLSSSDPPKQSASSSPLPSQLAQITPTTSFFALGGDSLSAIYLSQLCQTAGLDLSLQDIFDYPTLAEQCGLLEGRLERVVRKRPDLVFVSERETGG